MTNGFETVVTTGALKEKRLVGTVFGGLAIGMGVSTGDGTTGIEIISLSSMWLSRSGSELRSSREGITSVSEVSAIT